jgi:hypothetical protein
MPYSEDLANAVMTSLDAKQTITNNSETDSSTITSLSVLFGSSSERFIAFPCTALADFRANNDVYMPGTIGSDSDNNDFGATVGGISPGATGQSVATDRDRGLMRLCIRPPQDSEYDMSLTIEATSTEIFGGSEAASAGDSGGKQASTRSVLGVTVDAVNDAPRLVGVPEHVYMYEDYTEVCAWHVCGHIRAMQTYTYTHTHKYKHTHIYTHTHTYRS